MVLLGILLASPGFADAVSDGNRVLKAGRLDEALRLFEPAAQKGNASAQAGIGRVLLRRGQYESAEQAFRRAAQMDPAAPVPVFGQAEVLRLQGRCEDALPLYRKAVQMDRRFAEAQLGVGRCLTETGHLDEAIAELGKGMNWSREWTPRFLAARGAAHMARDSLRAAGIDFTRARELAPRDPAIRQASGEFYMKRGTWALAIPEFQAAVSLDSSDVASWTSLGQAADFAGQPDDALKAHLRATSLDSAYAPAQLGLGGLLFRAGAADPRRYAEAREPLEHYTRLAPKDPRGWSLLGRLYVKTGQREPALETLLQAERLGDRNKDMYTALGRAHADRKEWLPALEAFSKGEPGPEDAPVIAQILEVTGQAGAADSMYLRLLDRDSTSSRAAFTHAQRAKLRFRAKDYAGAIPLFERAISLDPRNGESHFFLGLSLKEMKRNPEALAALRTAAQIDSAKADRHFWLGVALDGEHSTDEAERAFRRSTELDSSSTLAGKAYRQLGFYRLMRKQWKDAVPLLRRAVDLDAADTQSWLWLAQGYQNSGDRPHAAEAYRRVLALDPNNTSARNGLKSLEVRRAGPSG